MLGGSRRPNIADSFSITTCCALRCLPASHKLTSGTLVVAELSLKPNAAVVRQIAGHDGTDDMKILPANGAAAVDAALALSATLPAAGFAIMELMQMEGQEIHTVNPERLIEARAAARRPPPLPHAHSHRRLSEAAQLNALAAPSAGPFTHPPTPHTVRQEDVMTIGEFPRHFPEAVVVGILRRRSSAAELHEKSHAHLTVEMARQLDLDEAAAAGARLGGVAGEAAARTTDVEVLLAPSQNEEVRRGDCIPYTPSEPLAPP